jgi:hypothetical protein
MFHNLMFGLDAMVMNDSRDRIRLHLTAEYVIIRALLEAATTALWILGPDDSDTRVTRALRLRHDELKHSLNLAKNFAKFSNTVHGREYLAQEAYVEGQIEDLKTLAADAHLDLASVTRNVTPSIIAAEGGMYVPDLGGPLTYWYGSTASRSYAQQLWSTKCPHRSASPLLSKRARPFRALKTIFLRPSHDWLLAFLGRSRPEPCN